MVVNTEDKNEVQININENTKSEEAVKSPVEMKVETTKEAGEDIEAANENTPTQEAQKDPEVKKEEKDLQ